MRFCAVSVPFVRFSSGCTKGLAPRIVFLSELLLFQDLQTFVSVVAFAREYPRYASWHKGFSAAGVWLRANRNCAASCAPRH